MLSPTIISPISDVVAPVMGVGGVTPPSFCSIMDWTTSFAMNSLGVVSGVELTVTNDGGGGGFYTTIGDTSWTSQTGLVSGECRFKSDTLTTSETFLIIGDGAQTSYSWLIYKNATKVLYDNVGGVNVATGLTGGANYTWGIKFNQATGTATWSDSENNSGPLTVDASYDNTVASYWATGGSTSANEVVVSETNLGNTDFWLPESSGRFCDY